MTLIIVITSAPPAWHGELYAMRMVSIFPARLGVITIRPRHLLAVLAQVDMRGSGKVDKGLAKAV